MAFTPRHAKGMHVANILVRDRRRPINEAKVQALMVSMEENDFFGAIELRLSPHESEEGLYLLVLGAHRLEAFKRLGGVLIPYTLKNLTDDEAAQIELDENLLAPELTILERAESLEERYQIWARRFPDRVVIEDGTARPKRGRPSNSANIAQFRSGAPETMGFTADVAAAVGLSKRTIDNAWATINGLPKALRQTLHGSPIANSEGLLRQLAAISDKAEQAQVAEVLIGGQTKNVADAKAIAAGNTPSRPAQTPVDETLKAFRRLWSAASPSAKAAILTELSGKKLPGDWIVMERECD